MSRLDGKRVLVCGAGSSGPGWGIGKATAVQFARNGGRVIAVDRYAERAQETCDLIVSEGGECVALACDVSVASDVATMVEDARAAFGGIDVLHNNVGIVVVGGAVTTSEADWDRVIEVNLKGMFLTCRSVLPSMLEAGAGVITNVSSTSGLRWQGTPYIGYASSKSAILQFTRSIAMEFAMAGIRANALLPGMIDTPLVRNALAGDDPDAVIAERNAACPMGRMGDPFEVARAASFLASDDASYISGASLVVDGGLTCRI